MSSTRPFIVIYVVWHPSFQEGKDIAESLYNHYRRDLYANITGGAGVSVMFRSEPIPGSKVPFEIDFDSSETSAVVALLDDNFSGDDQWLGYLRELARQADERGLGTRVFPVSISSKIFELAQIDEQMIRWDQWEGLSYEDGKHRLISDLTYDFCRMLRHYLECLDKPEEDEKALGKYLNKVEVFLSHSKHDEHGVVLALKIRDEIREDRGLSSFFDVHDIPAGLKFHRVILNKVKTSAVVALHTDSYSSREWCRKEIIESKKAGNPLVVANSITGVDERGFPYMGNVPTVRLDPTEDTQVDRVIGRLLDEVMKDFLWRCRVRLAKNEGETDNVFFLSRPPELLSLVNLEETDGTVVYPDPPLSVEEEDLFRSIAPGLELKSLTKWAAGEVE